MFRKVLAIIILLLLNCAMMAQDMLGVRNSNYAGIYGISLNPSTMVASRLYMDFNLIGVQGFVDNNYAFIQQDEFFEFMQTRTLPVYYTWDHERRYFDIDRSNAMKHGFQNSNIQGPSGMVVKGKHAFGITTAFRTSSSFRELPPDIAIFLYEAIDFGMQHNIEYSHDIQSSATTMAWTEIGFSYAYNFHRHRWNYWSAGISVKPLFSSSGMYAGVDHVDYMVHNDDSASVYDVSLEYGFAVPVDYETGESLPVFKNRGTGIGIDLGFTFQRTEKGHSTAIYSRICEPPFEEYSYRIGFSILDLGFVKFKNNALFNSYINSSTEWYKPYDTVKYSSIKNIIYKVDSYFLDNAEEHNTADYFTIYLPVSFSLQADVKMRKNVYVNFMGIAGIKPSKRYLYRPSIIAFTPRYETARWEVSLPVSIYEWNISQPRIGFSIRYGNVFFGFDRLNTIMGFGNFTGVDFYAGLRLNLSNAFRMNFVKGQCGMKKMYNIETFDYRNF